jgi:hypothetical protein
MNRIFIYVLLLLSDCGKDHEFTTAATRPSGHGLGPRYVLHQGFGVAVNCTNLVIYQVNLNLYL